MVEFYNPTEGTEFFRNRLQRRLNYQLFSPKVILPTFLSDHREKIFTLLILKHREHKGHGVFFRNRLQRRLNYRSYQSLGQLFSLTAGKKSLHY